MLKRANDPVRNGIHPASIISGYRVEKLGKVPLVVDAVQAVKMTNGINVLKTHGKGVKDSYLLNGYALVLAVLLKECIP
uniref:Uncharacterized protein n=1 Tax=Salix viminalis TaxID=40686 RepID=A0A6N2L895_SALVM